MKKTESQRMKKQVMWKGGDECLQHLARVIPSMLSTVIGGAKEINEMLKRVWELLVEELQSPSIML